MISLVDIWISGKFVLQEGFFGENFWESGGVWICTVLYNRRESERINFYSLRRGAYTERIHGC